MSTNPRPDPIRIGLVADEPIGLPAWPASLISRPSRVSRGYCGGGSMTELLASADLEYLVFDLHGSRVDLRFSVTSAARVPISA